MRPGGRLALHPRWGLALALLVGGCAGWSTYGDRSASLGALDPDVQVEEVPVRGYIVSVDWEMEEESGDVYGELLAVSDTKLWVLEDGFERPVPRHAVTDVQLEIFESTRAWAFGLTTGLGAGSAASHGIFAIFSLPTWMITGGIVSGLVAIMNDVDVPIDQLDELRQFARYPAVRGGDGSLSRLLGEAAAGLAMTATAASDDGDAAAATAVAEITPDARAATLPAESVWVEAKWRSAGGIDRLVRILTRDRTAGQAALSAATRELDRVEPLLAQAGEASDIVRLNRAAGRSAVPIDPVTRALLAEGLAVGSASGGAFAWTAAPLVAAWGFDGQPAVPSAADLSSALGRVNDAHLTLNPDQRTAALTAPERAIWVGDLAYAVAVDQAIAVLRAHGVTDALVGVGGVIGALGKKGDKPWRLGVQHPRRRGALAAVDVSDAASATAGDYYRFFDAAGVRYHDRLDPRTGRAARAANSVTVIAPRATTAMLWARALMVLGPSEGMAMVERLPETEAVFVAAGDQLYVSSGLADRLIR